MGETVPQRHSVAAHTGIVMRKKLPVVDHKPSGMFPVLVTLGKYIGFGTDELDIEVSRCFLCLRSWSFDLAGASAGSYATFRFLLVLDLGYVTHNIVLYGKIRRNKIPEL